MLRADGFQAREGANALGDQRVCKDDRAGVAEPAVGDGSKRLAAARGPERPIARSDARGTRPAFVDTDASIR